MKTAQCQKLVGRIISRRCGKPAIVEINGKPLCKGCAATVRRTQTARTNRRKAEEDHKQRVSQWQERMERAAKILGVEARLDVVGHNYIEAVVISLGDFEKLAGAAVLVEVK